MERRTKVNKGIEEALLIHRAGINQTTFRILITGPEDVIPVLARHMKKCIFDKHKVTNLKIHHAVSLNEEIASKLRSDGLHAVVLCTDASKLMMKSNIQETLKYLDFDIISTSMFIVNLIHPVAAIFPTVAEAVKKLSVAYTIHVFNILFEDEESVKFGLDRVSTAVLLGAKFIHGYEPQSL
uniref:Uncharacterized protein n=1 Tax=Daphnia galeata TaxID=27404 RepID=A0A8J2RIA1_9CRUS|nr:unnamed protein product [Daphnia galeata]